MKTQIDVGTWQRVKMELLTQVAREIIIDVTNLENLHYIHSWLLKTINRLQDESDKQRGEGHDC